MKRIKKSLFDTNPYLKDPVKYRQMLIAHVASSTAIETGASVEEVKKQISGFIGGHPESAGTTPEPKPQ